MDASNVQMITGKHEEVSRIRVTFEYGKRCVQALHFRPPFSPFFGVIFEKNVLFLGFMPHDSGYLCGTLVFVEVNTL